MIFKCLDNTCQGEISISPNAKRCFCPKCGKEYQKQETSKDLVRVKGVLYRANVKERMSKKQRLKLRRLKNERQRFF